MPLPAFIALSSAVETFFASGSWADFFAAVAVAMVKTPRGDASLRTVL
jgi:hypothetical protein